MIYYMYFFLSVCIYMHATKKETKKEKKKNTKKIERLIISQYCTQSLYEIADRTVWRPNGDTIHGFLVTFFFVGMNNYLGGQYFCFAFTCRSIWNPQYVFHNFLPHTHTFFSLLYFLFLTLSRFHFYCTFSSFTSHGNDFFFTSMVHDSFAWIWGSQYH